MYRRRALKAEQTHSCESVTCFHGWAFSPTSHTEFDVISCNVKTGLFWGVYCFAKRLEVNSAFSSIPMNSVKICLKCYFDSLRMQQL